MTQSRAPYLQAGLLTHGSSLHRRLPIHFRTVANVSMCYPITVALPWRILTAFPVRLWQYLESIFKLLSCDGRDYIHRIWRRQYLYSYSRLVTLCSFL